jgi:hypothetical protein
MRGIEVFEEAKCIGQPLLFESTLPGDHEVAKALCEKCPALAACRELLREEFDIARTLLTCGGGPTGTWAGQMVGKSVFKSETCGTPRGYGRHRQNAEPPCAPCLAAHNKQAAQGSARRRAQRRAS